MIKKPRNEQGENLYNKVCIKLVIVDESSKDRRIKEENWKRLESKLLFEVSEKICQGTGYTPYFGNIQSRQGHKILHCKTLAWLKGTIEGLELWEGSKLRLIPVKRQPRVRVFITGPILPEDRLLTMLKAQNRAVYPTEDWTILKMDPPNRSWEKRNIARESGDD
ncbi:uncharacterized protein LOC142224823 [Haematobia irritans]|uniref:uncharacterized protein LOC142224823 n=1 Tax=Haematobia irritans TaxID=7368 RepID=UPI003F504B9E